MSRKGDDSSYRYVMRGQRNILPNSEFEEHIRRRRCCIPIRNVRVDLVHNKEEGVFKDRFAREMIMLRMRVVLSGSTLLMNTTHARFVKEYRGSNL